MSNVIIGATNCGALSLMSCTATSNASSLSSSLSVNLSWMSNLICGKSSLCQNLKMYLSLIICDWEVAHVEGFWVRLSVDGSIGEDNSSDGIDGDGAHRFTVHTIPAYFEHVVVARHVIEHLKNTNHFMN